MVGRKRLEYASGEVVEIGDNVLIEQGRTVSVVEHIIESTQEMRDWHVDVKGVLLRSSPFAAAFWPFDEKHDPVVFVSYKTGAGR